jgi:endonuclease/exonuclease/phosphatase family metal-dependent hydrolase
VTLRVLTLNIWNDEGPWPERAARIREWLDRLDPDLVGLQEVLAGPGLDSLAELFAGRGFHLDFEKASDFWRPGKGGQRGLAFGNAVASRWPIAEREAVALPEGGDGETRCALSVTVSAPFGPLCFTSTHLNWKFHHGAIRERQVVALGELVLRRRPRGGFPPIVVGDFNAEPDSAEIRYVCGLQSLQGRSLYLRDAWQHVGAGGDGITWSNRNDYARPWLEPDRRIDYVFVGPPQRDGRGDLLGCRVVCDDAPGGVWPSDHFGVLAELRDAPMENASERR